MHDRVHLPPELDVCFFELLREQPRFRVSLRSHPRNNQSGNAQMIMHLLPRDSQLIGNVGLAELGIEFTDFRNLNFRDALHQKGISESSSQFAFT